MQTGNEYCATDTLAQGFRIGALRGAPTAEIQRLLAAFAERRRREGLRVAGVIQAVVCAQEAIAGSVVLRDLINGSTFPVFQNLGRNSSACSLDPGGITAACQSVLNAIDGGAGLVVLSKFGKLEEAGGGLLDAFAAAAEAGIPCVTGVAPAFAAPFLAFTGGFTEWIGASAREMDRWWTEACPVCEELKTLG
jgi:Protein of unknown function (DUF2478)